MALLVADIGGTHARFAVARGEAAPRLEAVVAVPTAAAPSLPGLLALARAHGLALAPDEAERVVLAVAGAVQAGRAWLPNAGLTVDAADPCLAGRGVVVNDFVAQAFATLHPEVADTCLVLQEGAPRPGPRAVAGAGTGFGACVLVPCPSGWTPLATELGHAPYPFEAEERDLAALVQAEAGEAIWDAVVSGPGLARVHRWHTGEGLAPAQVAARLRPGHPTAVAFARLYGRALRTLALATLPTDGLWVAGGVAARNPWLLQEPAMVAEFRRCRGYEDLLAAIPVRLVTHPEAGLLGAALLGRDAMGNR